MNSLKTCSIIALLLLTGWLPALAQVTEFEAPEKLSNELNSPAAEESLPLISSDGKTMYFVRSFHPDNAGGEKGGHDIWFSTREEGGEWTVAQNLTDFNSKANNAVAGLSEDGKTIYLINTYEGKNRAGVGISKATFDGSKWSDPVDMKVPGINPVNEFYSFYVTPEEDILLISMQDNFSKGKNDLYLATRDEQGSWNVPVNLGVLNTSGDEVSPFLSPDRKRLYFATDGRAGMGGYDIFYSERKGESLTDWTIPVNAAGINSGDFDAYFTMHKDGEVFFCSNRNDTIANIYSTKMVEKQEEPEAEEEVIADEDPVADTRLTEADLGEVDDTIEVVGVDKKPIDPKSQIANNQALDNIYFDYDKYFLRGKSKEVLDVVVDELKKDNSLKVRLVGHCDDRGSQEYNLPLSRNRAQSAREYLESKGIASNRIDTDGKGKRQPAASNATEEGRQLNRRVEIYFK